MLVQLWPAILDRLQLLHACILGLSSLIHDTTPIPEDEEKAPKMDAYKLVDYRLVYDIRYREDPYGQRE